jgi:hypothetical protein
MATETLRTFPDLVAFLTEKRQPHQASLDAQVVEMPARLPPLDDVLYLRWEKTLPYLQLVQPVVRNVPPDRNAAVLEAICRTNHALPLPGFALEFDRRFIYFRRCLPVYEEGIPAAWFEKELGISMAIARDMCIALRGVVAGAPADQVMAIAKAKN